MVSPTYQGPDLESYDKIIVCFSGGKDSLACLLYLLERGVAPERIELHHNLIDGREGSTLMDWPVTEAYCEAIAKAFGIAISYSWRVGGFEREMLRNDEPTAPVAIPCGDGHKYIGGDGPKGTRLMFPQQSNSLSVRWCSSYGKSDAFSRWLCNDPQFSHSRTLVITGERAEESANRAKYATFEPHKSDRRNSPKLGRLIDHYRPVHSWSTKQVWEIIERWGVVPHPCYYLNYGRASCRFCIFSSKNQWATGKVLCPDGFEKISRYEQQFSVTIHRSLPVSKLAESGTPYPLDPFWVEVANSKHFTLPVLTHHWSMPRGAFGESCGPS